MTQHTATQHQSTQSQPHRPAAPTTSQGHFLQHGAIGIAAVAASAQQIRPKEAKRHSHPLPPFLREQD